VTTEAEEPPWLAAVTWRLDLAMTGEDITGTKHMICFLDFPIYLQSVEILSDSFSKWCVGKRGRVEECSVAPHRNKRVKTLCACQEKKVTN
jgi:hypothetical protein